MRHPFRLFRLLILIAALAGALAGASVAHAKDGDSGGGGGPRRRR